MKKLTLLLVLFFPSFLYHLNCQSIIDREKNENLAIIRMAINDFAKLDKLSSEDSVFSVDIFSINDDIIGVSIIGAINKLVPTPENGLGSSQPNFPTQFCVVNSKLFYWYDSTEKVNLDLIKVLSAFHQIDSVNVNGIESIPEVLIDDSKEGVDYFFCRKNIAKYKKIVTNRGKGYYKPPKIKCKNR